MNTDGIERYVNMRVVAEMSAEAYVLLVLIIAKAVDDDLNDTQKALIDTITWVAGTTETPHE